jgi:uncharacterized protein
LPATRRAPKEFDLVVGRTRCGLGLFAAGPIPKGVRVVEYTGVLITEKQVEKSRSRYLFDVGGEGALDGSHRSNRARYINHSCRPNCESVVRRKRVFIRSIRNIRPGEELTYDYGKDYFDNFINSSCRCLKCMPEISAKPARAIARPMRAKPTKPKAAPKPAPKPAKPGSRPVPRVEPIVATPIQEPRRKAA